jgi:hypothetical protein
MCVTPAVILTQFPTDSDAPVRNALRPPLASLIQELVHSVHNPAPSCSIIQGELPLAHYPRMLAVAAVVAVAGLLSALSAQPTPRVFFVSPVGDDSWSGTLPSANRNLTDGPFATPEHARDAIRALREKGALVGAVKVVFREGTYAFARTLKLTPEDSGTKDSPVEWSVQPGESVTLTGSKDVTDFHPVTDPAILSRLAQNARSKIVVTDLRAQGIMDYGQIVQRGGPGMELFFNRTRMTLARWPNSGWLRVAGVPQTGDTMFNKGLEREKRFDGVPVGRHYGRIAYDSDRPQRWLSANEIYLHGYWTWDWSDSYQRVQSIDAGKKEITLQQPHHWYGYTKNQRYYFLNILEELDTPGEWYLDRRNGLLYFWPPEPIGSNEISVSLLDEPLVSFVNASYVTFSGMAFERSRSNGVTVNEGTHILIAGCTFRLLGNDAVVIDGGTENGVQSCDLYELSLGGIRLKGGDRKLIVPCDNFAVNNHIHHYSSWMRTGQYALFLEGVGDRVQHNLIHDAPHEGITLRGNDHLIEFNEVYHVCQETGDAGAFHTGRDWTWRGNVIRYNYFHHLLGPGLHGVMAVYLDDWASGFLVYGNIFYKSGRSAMIGGGRDNTIENNIFVDCRPSVHVDARGLGWASYYFDGTQPIMFNALKEYNYRQPPYSTRYPALARLDTENPALPTGNRIVRNVSYGGRWLDIYDANSFDFSMVTMTDNVIADSLICRRLEKGKTGWDPYYLDIDTKDGYVLLTSSDEAIKREFRGNTFLSTDPGFVNLKGLDFRLKNSSPAIALGFKPIPVDKIGLQADGFRRTLPPRPSLD